MTPIHKHCLVQRGNHSEEGRRSSQKCMQERFHVRPFPEIIHSVDVTFKAEAIPFAANVRFPVVPAPDRYIASVVIAIVITPAPCSFTNVITVPIAYATLALLSIVQIRAVASADG